MGNGKHYRNYTILGWIATLVGCALWSYGYFVGGSPSLLNWQAFSPHWIANYLPNWQAEAGMLLTLVASIPIYYGQLLLERPKK